jgi:hypothetical protein
MTPPGPRPGIPRGAERARQEYRTRVRAAIAWGERVLARPQRPDGLCLEVKVDRAALLTLVCAAAYLLEELEPAEVSG